MNSATHQPTPSVQTRLLGPALLVALVATSAFGLIALAVASHAGILRWDMTLAHWLHAHQWSVLTGAMRAVGWVHGVAGIGVLTAALAWWFWRVRVRGWLPFVLMAMPGVMLLNALLKQVFARPRPHFADPLSSLTSYSFPSGHVSQSTVFYGLLAAWLCMRVCQKASRVMIVVAASLMIVAVAVSRLYLGAHYLTDVVAAFFEGIGWLAVCYLAMAWPRPRNAVAGKSG